MQTETGKKGEMGHGWKQGGLEEQEQGTNQGRNAGTNAEAGPGAWVLGLPSTGGLQAPCFTERSRLCPDAGPGLHRGRFQTTLAPQGCCSWERSFPFPAATAFPS